MIAVPVIIVAAAAWVFFTGGRNQSTDDAYVQAPRVQISSNVSGRVIEVLIHENQQVKAGDVLFRLDPRDYDVAIESARAQLAQARIEAQSLKASYAPKQAAVDSARKELAYRQAELARQKVLTASGAGSQRELDQRANDVVAARQQLTTAEAEAKETLAEIGVSPTAAAESFPAVQTAQAALDRALLNRSYTVVAAPQDGLVTRVEQLQVGSYITSAQPLFSLVGATMWVEANFKESQLTYMRIGQHGEAEIDAFPGRKYDVHVESLSPGTGSAFSILPPENATGNWVKVTQRLPVRIAFDHPQEVAGRLHAGLSAKVSIDTEHRRTLFGGEPPEPPPRGQPAIAAPRTAS